jgi:hypothetical protein
LTLNDQLDVVLSDWTSLYTGSHPDNVGFFSNPSGVSNPAWNDAFSGTSYTYGSDAEGYKFVVTGDLYYYFSQAVTPTTPAGPDAHTLFGTANTLNLYTDSDADGLADDLFLSLDFTGDGGLVGDLSDGHDNPLHVAIYGLMQGNSAGLESVLGTEFGVDVTDTLAELTGSALLAESELLLAA